jgi:hypothetical protein
VEKSSCSRSYAWVTSCIGNRCPTTKCEWRPLLPSATSSSENTSFSYLVKAATEARAALGDGKSDAAAGALNKLLDANLGIGGVAESSLLRVKYTVTPNGLRVVDFTKGGPTVFAKGEKLNKGDLILRVGEWASSGKTHLDSLIESAYGDDKLETLVHVAKTRKVQTFTLSPAAAESGTADDKVAGSGSKSSSK